MALPAQTQVLPATGLLTDVITVGIDTIELIVEFLDVDGNIFPSTDFGTYSCTLWKEVVVPSVSAIRTYSGSIEVTGLKGYLGQFFSDMLGSGVCGVSIHDIVKPDDTDCTGFRILAREVKQ